MAVVDEDAIGVIDVETLEDRFTAILVKELPPSRNAPRTAGTTHGPSGRRGKASAGTWGKAAVSSAGQRAFTKTLGGTGQVVVTFSSAGDDRIVKTVRSVLACVPDLVRERQATLREKDIETLVDVMMPSDPPTDTQLALQLDNARARVRFLKEFPCLKSKEVQEASGHTAGNTSITASRWKGLGKIFSVTHGGTEFYPAFQFRDGQPHPSVAKVLAVLPKRKSPWQIAFWFTSSNSWLRGAVPAERLDDEAAVVMAAQREAEEVIG